MKKIKLTQQIGFTETKNQVEPGTTKSEIFECDDYIINPTREEIDNPFFKPGTMVFGKDDPTQPKIKSNTVIFVRFSDNGNETIKTANRQCKYKLELFENDKWVTIDKTKCS